MGVPPDKAPAAPSSGVGLSAHIRLAHGGGTSGCGGFACRLLALCAACSTRCGSYPLLSLTQMHHSDVPSHICWFASFSGFVLSCNVLFDSIAKASSFFPEMLLFYVA
ncbi:MAG: hypothetical protein ACK4EX_02705 [Thermaurantimonas sp.]|uniref:hypothetical protein n=1 Tax=Thermaurantimonas sp. TaxID=2681568 RepID=UPI00391A22CE